MVTFKKKKDSEKNAADERAPEANEARSNHGVQARGNALRDAIFFGLLIALIPAVIGAVYLMLLRGPGQKADMLEHVSQSYAAQQAQTVARSIGELRERIQSAVASPVVLSALVTESNLDQAAAPDVNEAADLDTSPSVNPTRELEALLEHFFPEAIGVRVLPLGELGTADLGENRQGLRNHIEVDLVRRVSNEEAAEPEAYEFQGQWLMSLAQMASRPGAPQQRAVLLVTLPIEALKDWLVYPGESPGLFVLEQMVFGNTGSSRSQAIAQHGSPAATAAAQTAEVEGTPWRVSFAPSAPVVNELTGNISPDLDVLGIVTIGALIGFGLVLIRSTKTLQSEVDNIIGAAEHRTAMEVKIPQLLPLAQNFRKLSLRRAKGGVAAPSVEAQGSAATSAPVTAIEGPSSAPLPSSIFRAYDIRGVANEELDDETVYRIGSAIGTMAGELGEQTLVIGYDGRTSSRRIKAVVEKALLQAGRDVIDLGLIPTPLMYFATTQLDAKSGVMITGSHSPAEYNGMKIVLAGRTIAEGTIERLRDMAEQGRFSKGAGHQIQQDISSDYLDEIVSDIAIAVPLKIVVDAGNGATGHIAPALLEELGCDVVPLYCEVDGEFPNHSPDTSNEANLQDLINEVLANDADFGVAFDGDGDRIAVVTRTGRIMRTDTLMMLFARDVVSRNPGADVVYDVKCSRNLAQLITSLGGRPVLWKTGHALMKQKMHETGALLGGEFSGHVFFGERWYGFDDAMYAAGRLAEILSSQELGLDEFIADLPNDVSTPEILVPVSEEAKFGVIEKFVAQAHFKDGKTNNLDGLRVDFQDGWGLLRASNTGPALTARFEAKDEATLEMIKGLFRNQLSSVAPDLDIPF